MIEKFIDVGGAELLAFGDEEEAVGGVDALGEDHARGEFGEEDFFFFARNSGTWDGADENADGFGIVSGACIEANGLDGILGITSAFGESNSDCEQAGKPWDFGCDEVVGITLAIEAFMV